MQDNQVNIKIQNNEYLKEMLLINHYHPPLHTKIQIESPAGTVLIS